MGTVLITGANRGIGLEMAKQYADNGWDVIGTAREPNKAEELNAIANAKTMQLDAADDASVANFTSEIGDQPIDLYINNAGIYGPQEFDRDGWLELLNVNVVAPVKLANALKDNVAKSDGKKMVVISSQVGSIAENESGDMMYYRTSKAAVNQAWKSLSNQWKDDGLTLTMMHPGWVQTDMGGPNADLTPQESVSGMRQVIENLDHSQTGAFHDYSGREIPW
ncbi:SDR family oxidoreductase [Parasphingorhabdus cellanae]|uniref:SDR family oxidoreductase n=1 Tax=Parasphingorhabdus cellanae TaxID=2806553 RepID=A0ABX7T2P3_9SPHN|nr:SDR family oxidoreductase [Parasphingorhabdus cellanae]QTD55816.1 SDR family oxidoreductase [Parasphingorhabdus cellanae]